MTDNEIQAYMAGTVVQEDTQDTPATDDLRRLAREALQICVHPMASALVQKRMGEGATGNDIAHELRGAIAVLFSLAPIEAKITNS